MHIRAGYEITYECPQPTPMLLLLNVSLGVAHEQAVLVLNRSEPGQPPLTCDGVRLLELPRAEVRGTDHSHQTA